MSALPDMSAVASSLEEYDRKFDDYSALVASLPNAESSKMHAEVVALRRNVSEAFADATSDRNARDTALLVTPGMRDKRLGGVSWLRQLLERHGYYSGIRE